MKQKLGWLLILMTLMTISLAPLYAYEDKEMGMMGGKNESGMMGGKMMEGKGMMGGKMKGMMPMMKSVVATSDGGIVVVAGNKITKYDGDLNVVKEVEMKMDMPMMDKGPEMGADEDSPEHEGHH